MVLCILETPCINSNVSKTTETKFSANFLYCELILRKVQCDSFGTRPKKMRISQRLFIRF